MKGPSSHQNRLGVSTVSADRAEAGSEEHLAGFITVLFPEADLELQSLKRRLMSAAASSSG